MEKSKLSFIKPLVLFFTIGLFILSCSRLALFVLYNERLLQIDNIWKVFTLGLRIDIILMSYLSFLPCIILCLFPTRWKKLSSFVLSIYCSSLLFIIAAMELMTPEFINQYDTRPNKLFLEYLIYPREVATMLIKARPLLVIGVLLVLLLLVWLSVKLSPRLFQVGSSKWKYRLLLFPILGFFLFWGARGSLSSRRPINGSNSVFSNDQLANVIGVNSLYTVSFAAYSLKNEIDPSQMYGKMSEEESLQRVKKYMLAKENDFVSKTNPLLHTTGNDSITRPYNLVIFLQESLGAEYVGSLGGLPLTPHFDQLTEEGILFTNLYCTGTRSVRGIEAVTTGFLPSPSESVVKLPNAQDDFFTLAAFLKLRGYDTSFIYGGMSNFDNMGAFFSGNGFETILDETSFVNDGYNYKMKGTWGYSDEDLVVKANSYFKSKGDKPFFSLMFSSSNHEPFEFPEGSIALYEEPQATVHNAMKYADHAIGLFFELAKQEDYFKNTAFLIVADHNTRTYGSNLVPVDKFHIPALLITPDGKTGRYDKLCSQIDLPVTLLSLLGGVYATPMVGRDLLNLPDSIPGRAIMQYHDINAFRVEDKMIVMQPKQPALQFELIDDKHHKQIELENEFASDALAHVLLANYLYKGRKYKVN